MNIASDDKELRRSIRLLGSVLTRVLKTQARPEIAATVEQLQQRFTELLRDQSLSRRQHLLETINGLDPEAIGEVVRVFNRYFSLLNIAEESHYLKIRRRQAERGGHYWPGSFHDTLLKLKESGVTADKLQVLLDELLYLPVMTAHPTEAKRRTVKSALRNIFLTQEALGDNRVKGYFRKEALQRLQCQIQLLWKTDEVRTRKLGVADEIDAGLFYFPLSLFQATARVYRNFERSLSDVYGEDVARKIRVPSFLCFGSWIGGDRDGNPNVTSETTVLALRLQAQTILQEYSRRLDELRGQLSHSDGLCELSGAFLDSLEADRVSLGVSIAVGWSMSESMQAKLVNDALIMALWQRKPGKGLIWHTDRGSQYASASHRALLNECGIIQSMSRKGNCWDNAVAESFFHTLKTELIHHQRYQTRAEAKQDIFEYIEVFYNRERFHSANNYLSPVDYERQQKAA